LTAPMGSIALLRWLAVAATAAGIVACRQSRTAEGDGASSQAPTPVGTLAAAQATPAASGFIPVFGGDVEVTTLPLTVSIETLGGVSTVLIPRGTRLPTLRRETFSTAADDQPSIEVHVLVGESPRVGGDVSIGKFSIVQIPPASRGVPKIEVTFALDAHGAFQLSARDLATGRSQPVAVEDSLRTALSRDAVSRMLPAARDR
jgi:molecular chaperone DnaK (HSP70)